MHLQTLLKVKPFHLLKKNFNAIFLFIFLVDVYVDNFLVFNFVPFRQVTAYVGKKFSHHNQSYKKFNFFTHFFLIKDAPSGKLINLQVRVAGTTTTVLNLNVTLNGGNLAGYTAGKFFFFSNSKIFKNKKKKK